jgi:haloalkane dehalogenase
MQSTGWVDREAYPFVDRFYDLPAGRMHYVDEGSGPPIVFVHGTPTWSFLYRYLIRCLSADYRCVAPDHLGFGLSDKPAGWSYRPQEGAANLRKFIEGLDLKDFTLVVHDFGGPIGLSYALDCPRNVRRLVIFNTWLWGTRGDPHFSVAGKLLDNALGRLLYLRLGFSVRVMLPFGGHSPLPPEIRSQYLAPLSTPADRVATWACAQALLGESDWYESLWQRRAAIQDKPALILWGLKDGAFRPQDLARLETIFRAAQVRRYPAAGHLVQEAEGEQLCPVVAQFLNETNG